MTNDSKKSDVETTTTAFSTSFNIQEEFNFQHSLLSSANEDNINNNGGGHNNNSCGKKSCWDTRNILEGSFGDEGDDWSEPSRDGCFHDSGKCFESDGFKNNTDEGDSSWACFSKFDESYEATPNPVRLEESLSSSFDKTFDREEGDGIILVQSVEKESHSAIVSDDSETMVKQWGSDRNNSNSSDRKDMHSWMFGRTSSEENPLMLNGDEGNNKTDKKIKWSTDQDITDTSSIDRTENRRRERRDAQTSPKEIANAKRKGKRTNRRHNEKSDSILRNKDDGHSFDDKSSKENTPNGTRSPRPNAISPTPPSTKLKKRRKKTKRDNDFSPLLSSTTPSTNQAEERIAAYLSLSPANSSVNSADSGDSNEGDIAVLHRIVTAGVCNVCPDRLGDELGPVPTQKMMNAFDMLDETAEDDARMKQGLFLTNSYYDEDKDYQKIREDMKRIDFKGNEDISVPTNFDGDDNDNDEGSDDNDDNDEVEKEVGGDKEESAIPFISLADSDECDDDVFDDDNTPAGQEENGPSFDNSAPQFDEAFKTSVSFHSNTDFDGKKDKKKDGSKNRFYSFYDASHTGDSSSDVGINIENTATTTRTTILNKRDGKQHNPVDEQKKVAKSIPLLPPPSTEKLQKWGKSHAPPQLSPSIMEGRVHSEVEKLDILAKIKKWEDEKKNSVKKLLSLMTSKSFESVKSLDDDAPIKDTTSKEGNDDSPSFENSSSTEDEPSPETTSSLPPNVTPDDEDNSNEKTITPHQNPTLPKDNPTSSLKDAALLSMNNVVEKARLGRAGSSTSVGSSHVFSDETRNAVKKRFHLKGAGEGSASDVAALDGDDGKENPVMVTPPRSTRSSQSYVATGDEINDKRLAAKVIFAGAMAARKFDRTFDDTPPRQEDESGEGKDVADPLLFCTSPVSETIQNFTRFNPLCTGLDEDGDDDDDCERGLTRLKPLKGGAFSSWSSPLRVAKVDESSIVDDNIISTTEKNIFLDVKPEIEADGEKVKEIESSFAHADGQYQDDGGLDKHFLNDLYLSPEPDDGAMSPLHLTVDDLVCWVNRDILAHSPTTHDIKTDGDSDMGHDISKIHDWLTKSIMNEICVFVTNKAKQYKQDNCDDSLSSKKHNEDDDNGGLALMDISYTDDNSHSCEHESVKLQSDQVKTIASTNAQFDFKPFTIPAKSAFDSLSLTVQFFEFLQQISHVTGVSYPIETDPLLERIRSDQLSSRRSSVQQNVFVDISIFTSIFTFFYEVTHRCTSPEKTTESKLTLCTDFNVIKESICLQKDEDDSSQAKDRSTSSAPITTSPKTYQSIENTQSQACSTSTNQKHSPVTHSKQIQHNYRYSIPPRQTPSPFETAVWNMPCIVVYMLSFLGDPAAVCRIKGTNKFCNRIIMENEQIIMRDAVRLGGLSMHLRPAFWIWVTLEKYKNEDETRCPSNTNRSPLLNDEDGPSEEDENDETDDFLTLRQQGSESNWHGLIERDVERAFGNLPPHKTGARLRADSIVRALVLWGRKKLTRRSMHSLDPYMDRETCSKPPWEHQEESESSQESIEPTDTVSDWGANTKYKSCPDFGKDTNICKNNQLKEEQRKSECSPSCVDIFPIDDSDTDHQDQFEVDTDENKNESSIQNQEEMALTNNCLPLEVKTDMQNKLRNILFALAASHPQVGYCQGMDYIVAHLLRVLKDTASRKNKRGALPAAVRLSHVPNCDHEENNDAQESAIVEETVYRVMDTFFTMYDLRHMYWPELRCLKTCCRVFERLIKKKLPVLADHFDHHDLNVGLFALGWFQTLFLYLPSMPSATVCHMWDIWLVERSFKIFFRVGTAILFLSQPILLNHELEGMMTYLNTFPDATLLNPDILIACALQIKVTNRMLMEIEMECLHY